MSTVITDNLTGKTAAGNVTITSEGGAATMQLQQGVAKAWVDVPAGLGSINASFNVSSLDDDGAGDGGVNYATSMSSANYAISGTSDDAGTSTTVRVTDITQGTVASGSFDFELVVPTQTSAARANSDSQRGFYIVHGDLA